MLAIWLGGLIRRRAISIIGSASGVAIAVALMALLGAFLETSSRSMTVKAVAAVPVDWQIKLAMQADPQAAIAAIRQAVAYRRIQSVAYAAASGFVAMTGGTVQTTGPSKVLGVTPTYWTDFPGQLRLLIGSLDGVLLTQQAAANLHATVDDNISIERPGLPPAAVKVAGIVDLPNADSLFQSIGSPANTSPPAPPDNVLILPLTQWHAVFDTMAAREPGSVQDQLHVALDHADLPSDPADAYVRVSNAARNLEARLAGGGILADNLAARLNAVRGDALYAEVLFLFLGTPGALLAILLSDAVVASGNGRRRREQSLLRIRGAAIAQILRIATIEAASIGVVGITLGFAIAGLAAWMLFGSALFSRANIGWFGAASLLGFAATLLTALLPAWRQARHLTVARAVAPVPRDAPPLWLRLHLDLLFLLAAGLLFWSMQRHGYQIVLAPEGVPATSVDYYAFVSPALLWIALALISARLLRVVLGPGRRLFSAALRPVAGNLADLAAEALYRQRDRVTRAFTVVLLAMAFATSTAVFDATYQAQARVDATLTNGADVTVTGGPDAPAGRFLAAFAALPDALAARPLQHRLAYVGSDLQDLYGIDPTAIGDATPMSDAYFQNGDATATLAALARTPDGVLVSAETVQDYQLLAGDRINLRLLNASDHQYHKVPFRLVGIVREFPIAPRDSFLVANAGYIASQTGSSEAEVVLLRSRGDAENLAREVKASLGPASGLRVSDVGESLRLVSSSLTAIDVRGLTGIELGFAALMLFGAAGIVFVLDLAERRRGFAIMAAIGAKPVQIGAFVRSEGLLVFAGGAVLGLLAGLALAEMLVRLLSGVFDPPPDGLTIPWIYLAVLAAAMLAAVATATVATRIILRRPIVVALKAE